MPTKKQTQEKNTRTWVPQLEQADNKKEIQFLLNSKSAADSVVELCDRISEWTDGDTRPLEAANLLRTSAYELAKFTALVETGGIYQYLTIPEQLTVAQVSTLIGTLDGAHDNISSKAGFYVGVLRLMATPPHLKEN